MRNSACASREAVAKLSEEHRTAILLREIEGLQYDEIAQVMQTSIGTVMSRLFTPGRNFKNC